MVRNEGLDGMGWDLFIGMKVCMILTLRRG
jgi:hypothetical protein